MGFFRIWNLILTIIIIICPTIALSIFIIVKVDGEIYAIILVVLIIIFAILVALRENYYFIFFKKDVIKISGELPILGRVKQVKDEIKYGEITDIRLNGGYFDSRKVNFIVGPHVYRLPALFIEFVLAENKAKLMLISGFTQKQKQQMLDKIGEKTGIIKNYKQLKQEFIERVKSEENKWKP